MRKIWMGITAVCFAFFFAKLPINSWSVEALIAQNLIRGNGFVMFPHSPPALWRPPLTVILLVPLQWLLRDPALIYTIFATACMTAFVGVLFGVVEKFTGSRVAANLSAMLVLMTPAYLNLVGSMYAMLGYVLMLLTVTTAVGLTLREKGTLAGFGWALAFLARPETVNFWAVSIVFLLARRRWSQAGWCALAFLSIFLPTNRIFQSTARAHDLLGQLPIYTFYTGEASSRDLHVPDPDGAGYLMMIEKYGDPENYDRSFVKFALANPGAISTRIANNARLFARKCRRLFNPWDYLAFFVVTMLAATGATVGGTPLLYAAMLLAVSPHFLLFHCDPRYAMGMTLMLTIFVFVMGARLARFPSSARPYALATATILFFVQFGFHLTHAPRAAADLTPFRQLAKVITEQAPGIPTVAIAPPENMPYDPSDLTWVSYFANASTPVCNEPPCETMRGRKFPGDRIYSFAHPRPEFFLYPVAAAAKFRGAVGAPSWQGEIAGLGVYALVGFFATTANEPPHGSESPMRIRTSSTRMQK